MPSYDVPEYEVPDEIAEANEIDLRVMREGDPHDRYLHFHAVLWTPMCRYVPNQLNILLSAHEAVKNRKLKEWVRDAPYMRTLLLDSGAFSTLTAIGRGKGTAEQARDWCQRQDDIVAAAWEFHKAGCPPSQVASLDLPTYMKWLDPAGITVAEAQQISYDNIVKLQALEVPPQWKRVYMIQGSDAASYVKFAQSLEELGVLDEIREGNAWLGVGGTLGVKPPLLYEIYNGVRGVLGGAGHIHALGISRRNAISYMATRRWCQSSDSSTAQRAIVMNHGRYHTRGPRPTYLKVALAAAELRLFDLELVRAIRDADARPQVEQLELEGASV